MNLEKKKSILAQFHDENHPPYSMDRLAEKLNLQTYRAEMKKHGISGWIERIEDDKFKIVVNANHPIKRRRFTLAHEIAHYVLHEGWINRDVVDNVLYRSNLSNKMETEANELAAEILMPYSDLLDDLYEEINKVDGIENILEKAGPKKELFDNFIPELAEKYDVSKAAMQIRIGTKFGLWPND